MGDLNPEERNTLLLALAHLAVERPGWTLHLYQIAEKFNGCEEFQEFLFLGNPKAVAVARRLLEQIKPA